MEEYARVLDYMPSGHPDSKRFKREPLVLALGEGEFKLLELVPKDDASITIGDRLYIGKDPDQRSEIQHVKRRIGFEELTSAAQTELPYAIVSVIEDDVPRFIRMYNEAGPISTRYHTLELLPGLGKKTLFALLDERGRKEFSDFRDLEGRVGALHQPEKLLAKRIENEIADTSQKYRIFVGR
jgi:putative nucleotide binding protein